MDGPKLLVIATGAAAALVASTRLTPDRFVVLGLLLAAIVAVVLLDRWDRAAARRAQAAAIAARPGPEWAISLLVDADETSGILRPIVQLFGPKLPSDINVNLHVGDERGEVSLATERGFSEPATKTDLVLGELAIPDGLPFEKAVLCDWTVAVSHGGRQIACRSGPLTAAGRDNDEGELQAPDLEPVPEMEPPPPSTPDPVRSLRWTIGLSCAGGAIAIGGYLLTTLSAWLWIAAVPLLAVAGILVVAAALLLHTTCPLCGRPTTIVGRTGAQRCDSCHQSFTLAPV